MCVHTRGQKLAQIAERKTNIAFLPLPFFLLPQAVSGTFSQGEKEIFASREFLGSLLKKEGDSLMDKGKKEVNELHPPLSRKFLSVQKIWENRWGEGRGKEGGGRGLGSH